MKKAQQYHIRKATRPENKTVGYLSPQKKRWLPLETKHNIGLFSECDVDKFIRANENDKNYYYFKTLA